MKKTLFIIATASIFLIPFFIHAQVKQTLTTDSGIVNQSDVIDISYDNLDNAIIKYKTTAITDPQRKIINEKTELIKNNLYRIYPIDQFYNDPISQTWKQVEYATTTAQKAIQIEPLTTFKWIQTAYAQIISPGLNNSAYGDSTTCSGAHDTSGTGVQDPSPVDLVVQAYGNAGTPQWKFYRTVIVFDTSALSDTDIVASSSIFLWPYSGANADSESYDIVASHPASTASLATTDYGGAFTVENDTSFSELAYTSINLNAYNAFSLNTLGKNHISATSTTSFGVRTKMDITGHSICPTGNNYLYFRGSAYTGTSEDPYLDVLMASSTTGTATSTTATSTAVSITNIGEITFGIAIIIVLLCLQLIAFLYNRTGPKKKPWQ